MKGMVIALILAIALVSFSFAYTNLDNFNLGNFDNKNLKAENKAFEFSTFTSAVCENKEESVYCKDELFINCNGETSKVIDIAECSGIRLDLPKVSGSAVFSKNWKDPRA